MKRRLKIEDIPRLNVFKAPPGYFEDLPRYIQQRIAALDNWQLEQLPKRDVFAVPADYFEDLQAQILRKTIEATTSEIRHIEKQNIFETPQDYFETLQSQIQKKVTQNTAPKLYWIDLRSLKTGLAAAFVVLLLGFSAWWYFNSMNEKEIIAAHQTQKKEPVKQEAKLNDKEQKLIKENKTEKLKDKATNKIPAKIIQPGSVLAINKNKSVNQEQSKKPDLFAQITKKDIVEYLKTQQEISHDELLEVLIRNKGEQAVAEGLAEFAELHEELLWEEISEQEIDNY